MSLLLGGVGEVKGTSTSVLSSFGPHFELLDSADNGKDARASELSNSG